MVSLDGVSSTTSHPTNSPTDTTQTNVPDTKGTSPVNERSFQDLASSSLITGAEIASATAAAASVNGHPAPLLNPRSCTTCRKRKVRCDKRHPCANCTKANIDCVFPGPGRAPRRSRKPPDTELLARLRRLEAVVQNLGTGLDEEGRSIELGSEGAEPPQKPPTEDHAKWMSGPPTNAEGIFGLHTAKRDNTQSDGLVKEFGRLTVDGGRSRYVSNKFWVSLSEEVAEMQDILDDPTDDEDDYPSPGSGSTASINHQGYLFNYCSISRSLRNFHPPAPLIHTYWRLFKDNVDPLIKIFHRPSTELAVAEAAKSLDHLSKPTETMMFAIYFAVITSLSDVECLNDLGIEKQTALETYRFGFEQAMARADFLSTQELVVLQSFVLFLTCVRRFDDSRYAWTLTGLVIRMAQALGVHRDGLVFGLSPFETEMRRRLWWQICNLDMRASEDHGSDPSIVEQTFDTKFPLNINDDDIWPGMSEAPEEKEGRTEMLFDLLRFTVSTTVRRLSYAPPGPGPCREKSARITLEDKEHLIEELHQYLEKKYLKYCDMNVPLDWVAATVSRLILAKMWLIVHHPFQREDGGAGLPQETKDRLFLTSVEVIEFSRLLETETSTLKWGWLFRTYVQWHAVAFVLSQLCVRTSGPEVDKAWVAVESVFDEWGGVVSASKRGMLWKPLRKLMTRARAARMRELEKQCRFPLDGSLGPAGLVDLNAAVKMNEHETTTGITATDNPSLSPDYCLPPHVPSSGVMPLDIYCHPPQISGGLSDLQARLAALGEAKIPLDLTDDNNDWTYTNNFLPPNNNNNIFPTPKINGNHHHPTTATAPTAPTALPSILSLSSSSSSKKPPIATLNPDSPPSSSSRSHPLPLLLPHVTVATTAATTAEMGAEVGFVDETMDWVGWDDMVQDFRMEVENGLGVERGARVGAVGGVINWW